MSITDFQVEPEMEKVLTDFYIKPNMDPHLVGEEYNPMPLMFYDNEDGFWDNYIQHKVNRWGEAGLTVRRPFLKH